VPEEGSIKGDKITARAAELIERRDAVAANYETTEEDTVSLQEKAGDAEA